MNENLRANDFAELARRYIDVIDTPTQDRVDWLRRIEVLLAKLVASAYDLPQVEPTTSEPDWQNLRQDARTAECAQRERFRYGAFRREPDPPSRRPTQRQ